MKKLLLMSVALLALTAGTAAAAGLNLGWINCVGQAGYQLNDPFACNTNATSPTHMLVGSYSAPAGLDSANGNQAIMDLQTVAAVLSPWWTMGTGGCPGRTATPTVDFNFLSGPTGCVDYWGGLALGAVQYTAGLGGPNRAQFSVICATAEANAFPIAEGEHVYSFKVFISNARTVGTGLCAGCTDAACIVFTSLKITQNTPLPSVTLTNPDISNFVTWRGGNANCPAKTPARSATWGSVKALYR